MSGNVAVVFCGYDEEAIKKSIPMLDQLRLRFASTYSVCVLNKEKYTIASAIENYFDAVVYNRNFHLEFGAYQAGLNLSIAKFGDLKGILFCNDTIHRKNYAARTLSIIPAMVETLNRYDPFLIGIIERWGIENFSIMDLSGNQWASTHLFYMSIEQINRLRRRVDYMSCFMLDQNESAGLNADSLLETFFRYDDEIVSEKLSNWLFGGGWHNSEALTLESFSRLHAKKAAILNEMYISFLSNKYGRLHCFREFESVMNRLLSSG